MTEGTEMRRPALKYEINLNTGIQILTLFVMVFGGGAIWQKQTADIEANTEAIKRLESVDSRHDAGLSSLQTTTLSVSTLELRVKRLEDGYSEVNAAVRTLNDTMNANNRQLEQALGQVVSDVRVMREVLNRVDRKLGEDATLGAQ